MVEWILLHKHRLSDLLLLLAIQTMLLREFGHGEPFSVGLLTYCAASVTRTTPFGLTRNFVLIFSGGSSFYLLGMELGSGCTLACLLPQTWRSLRMQQVRLASVPILEASGFMVPGHGASQAIYRIPRTLSCGDCCSPLGIFVGHEACPFSIK